MAATATFDVVNGNYSTLIGAETFSGTLTVKLVPFPSVVAADITTSFAGFNLEFTVVGLQQIGPVGNYEVDLADPSIPADFQLDIANAVDLFNGINGSTIAGDSRITLLSIPIGDNYSGSLDLATPLPAALPLFATGLGGLGLLGWRRKRKA